MGSEDAAATTQISIAVSRHPRRVTVINKRYVREKRKRYGTDWDIRTGRFESAATAADIDALITTGQEFGVNY